ncbi:MAG: hypothetical protein ACYTDY_09320 [Planctomycetota bacterium]|jgi:hypothetical protein
MSDSPSIEQLLKGQPAGAVADAMTAAAQMPFYVYPWKSLEADLVDSGRDRLPVVGYGSLVNASSANITLDEESVAEAIPVIALGAQRVFDYEMPDDVDRYGPAVRTADRAALNVHVTGRVTDTVNGVLLETRLSDIEAFRNREVGYDLLPVACVRWQAIEEPPFTAYILECPDEPRAGKIRTNKHIAPHLRYYEVCRSGALELGEDFLRYWLRTTYLADGVTRAEEWEGSAPL